MIAVTHLEKRFGRHAAVCDLRLQGMPPGSLREASGGTLRVLGLEALADRRAGGLSEGERMKVALGKARPPPPQPS